MLRINNLTLSLTQKSFFKKKHTVLRDINISVETGSVTAIIGANGAGKSTLLKCILGFLKPTIGNITIKPNVKTGFLPENPYYYHHLSLRELLWFSASSFNISRTTFKKSVVQLTSRVGMQDHLDTRIRNFSKGMTQRAGIAAALIHNPNFIIFDEPMSGLDPHGRAMVFDLIRELKDKGITVLFCSHILTDVERLCDQVVMMDKGIVVKSLSKNEFQVTNKLQSKASFLEQLFNDLTIDEGEQACGH